MPPLDAAVVARFHSKVDRSAGPDGCWPWTGARTPRGYGVLKVAGKNVAAHRIAAHVAGKDIAGRLACHSCDFPPCCNPGHIYAGSAADNMRDKAAKGRGNAPRGERHGNAKLTAVGVAAIRLRWPASGESLRAIARELGVSPQTVHNAATGARWANA